LPVDDSHLSRAAYGDAVVVAARGEFDLALSSRLREALEDAIREVSPRLVVDLAEASFFDSTGIGALMSASKLARANGGWVRLVRPQPNVRRVLELTQIAQVLGVYDDIESAVESETSVGGSGDPTG
jgi:anti-anti-sigma factor